jgi:hypothetical protein
MTNFHTQLKNLTAKTPLPAGRQEERKEVIFYFSRVVPGTNKKLSVFQRL